MPRFKLIPTDSPADFVEFDGVHAASALNVLIRRKFAKAEVHQDGRYLFTAHHGETAVWTISQGPEQYEKVVSLASRKTPSPVVALKPGGNRSHEVATRYG